MAKIQDAAKRLNLNASFVSNSAGAIEAARGDVSVLILDLNASGIDTVLLISTLKANSDTAGIPLIGFVSHVQIELRNAALHAGCDSVVARSAFAQNLPAMLQQFA